MLVRVEAGGDSCHGTEPGLVFEEWCSKQAGPNVAEVRDPVLVLPLVMVKVRDAMMLLVARRGSSEALGNAK